MSGAVPMDKKAPPSGRGRVVRAARLHAYPRFSASKRRRLAITPTTPKPSNSMA
jgi:hypothetical protein